MKYEEIEWRMAEMNEGWRNWMKDGKIEWRMAEMNEGR